MFKKYININRLVEKNEPCKNINTWAFRPEDHIVIEIKVDGSNASIHYDASTGKVRAFSRTQELKEIKDMELEDCFYGFLKYVDTLDKEKLKRYPNYIFFGEWMSQHKVKYKKEFQNIWILYDVYDLQQDGYLPQEKVRDLAQEISVPFIHVVYSGAFVSWNHCRKFMDQTFYTAGGPEEGIIIKNMSRLNEKDLRAPFYLKIVNKKYAEVKESGKALSEREKEKKQVFDTVARIVTEQRVEKTLWKMRDEGIIPERFGMEQMNLVAPVIAKRIYADCLKEEREAVESCGKMFGKSAGGLAIHLAQGILERMDREREREENEQP